MQHKTCFISTGAALPDHCVSNTILAQTVDTSDTWIRTRTGITQRYFAAPGELTSDLAIRAGKEALMRAGLNGKDIDMLILATTTPDDTFPATATKVQYGLGTLGVAFDVQAVCSGYLLAMQLADQAIRVGNASKVMIIGAETLSRILDFTDRSTAVLFGDGAGAVILGAADSTDARQTAVIGCKMQSDGAYTQILHTTGGVSHSQTAGVITMQGNEVFKQAVLRLSDSAQQLMKKTGVSAADIQWFIPHQANQRIIDAVGKKMALDPEKVISTVHLHANTSAASIPMALHHGLIHGQVKPGDIILHQAIGAGLIWGSALIRWA